MTKTLKLLGLLIVLSLFLAASAIGAPQSFPDGDTLVDEMASTPISYWSFDEGSGSTAADTSTAGNNNTGTLMNNPQWVQGVSSNALQFDLGSNQFVQAINNSDSLSIPSGSISITAWIKPNQLSGEMAIVSKDKIAMSARGNYSLVLTNGHLEFGFSPQPTGADVWIQTTGPVISANTWNYIGVTFNFGTGEKPLIYVNGKPVPVGTWQGSGDQANAPNTYTDPLYIGRSDDSGWFFDGVIDEVKLFDTVLPPEEIASEIQFIYVPLVLHSD
jgi:hypothetical protein